MVMKGKPNQGLYILEGFVVLDSMNFIANSKDTLLWHKRVRHINVVGLQ